MAITNNDILRRIRYTFALTDTAMMDIFTHSGHPRTRAQISDWLKKDTDDAFVEMADPDFDIFLNGFIIAKRGRKEGPEPAVETFLTNNTILRKLKIALNLTSDDILEILKLAEFAISPHELSALFRHPSHKHFRKCQDQLLRRFLHGMQAKFHPAP